MKNDFLTIGQTAIVDGWLRNYEPAETYDAKTCDLVDTDSIIYQLQSMSLFEANALADYIASLGYIFYCDPDDALQGWVMKPVN